MPFVFSGQDGGVWTMRSNKKCAAWESMAGTAVVLGRSGTACRAPTENKERVRDRASVARIVMSCCVGTGRIACATGRGNACRTYGASRSIDSLPSPSGLG